MNRKIIKLFSITVLALLLMTIGSVSKAAVQIKAGTTTHTNINVSSSYNLCYNMRETDSTLGNNSLDPHLTTNADWAAAAYLGVSSYGSVRNSTGTAVTIDGTSYNSTTNNITGIMNMGKNWTQTASLFPGASTDSNRTALENNLNTKYVETLGTTAADAINKGRAYGETSGWYSSAASYANTRFPVGMRHGVLGFYYDRLFRLGLPRSYIQTSTLELELRSRSVKIFMGSSHKNFLLSKVEIYFLIFCLKNIIKK